MYRLTLRLRYAYQLVTSTQGLIFAGGGRTFIQHVNCAICERAAALTPRHKQLLPQQFISLAPSFAADKSEETPQPAAVAP